jgi:hypothetical protein
LASISRKIVDLQAEEGRLVEQAQLLAGCLALVGERRRPAAKRPKAAAAPGTRVLRASKTITVNGTRFEPGDPFTAEEVQQIRPQNLDAMVDRGLVYWDGGERFVAARSMTAGGRRYEVGDVVEPRDVGRTAPVLLSERRIRRVVADDDLPPAA